VVAERTGLSHDLVRVWERRYGAVHPTRTGAGERLYSDADVERLRLLDAAVAGGRRIGRVARLPTSELAALVAEDAAVGRRRAASDEPVAEVDVATVERMFERVRALDAHGLDDLSRRAAARFGVPAFLERVAAPLLRRIGDEWHAGEITIAEEHLASAVVANFVGESLRSMGGAAGADDLPRLLVGTPPGARHVIGAAMVAATAAADGWEVVFLGAELPAGEIVAAAQRASADAVAVSVVYAEDDARLVDELRTVSEALPAGVPLLVGGRAALPIAAELSAGGILVGDTLAALRELLARSEKRTRRARFARGLTAPRRTPRSGS
jgi:methanogenic corrinoid protein MtbC1